MALQEATLNFTGVRRLDKFDETFEILFDGMASDFDLMDYKLFGQVRAEETTDPIMTFDEDNNTLVKSASSTGWNITLHQDGDLMTAEAGVYYYTIVMFIDDSNAVDHPQTIVSGTITIIEQYTEVAED